MQKTKDVEKNIYYKSSNPSYLIYSNISLQAEKYNNIYCKPANKVAFFKYFVQCLVNLGTISDTRFLTMFEDFFFFWGGVF